MSEFHNRDGQPIDMETWAQLFKRDDYKRVASDWIGDAHVSTIWLGMPLLGNFETMVFGGALDCEQWRWATEAEAVAGHAVICELARESVRQ